MCKLQLLMVTQDGSQALGSLDIDLAPQFNAKNETMSIPLSNLSMVENASITVMFTVTHENEEVQS